MERHKLLIKIEKYKRKSFLKKEIKRLVLKSIKINKTLPLSKRYVSTYYLSKLPRFSSISLPMLFSNVPPLIMTIQVSLSFIAAVLHSLAKSLLVDTLAALAAVAYAAGLGSEEEGRRGWRERTLRCRRV